MKLEENTTNNNHRFLFFKALTMVLIALRLLGYIDWAWYWVVLPLFIPAILVIVAMVVIFFVGIIIELLERLIGNDK